MILFVMKYTLVSSAPLFIFHNQHKILNNLYLAHDPPTSCSFQQNQLQENGHIQCGIFSRSYPEEIAVQNVSITKSSFTFRTQKKTVIKLLTQNDIFLNDMQQNAT